VLGQHVFAGVGQHFSKKPRKSNFLFLAEKERGYFLANVWTVFYLETAFLLFAQKNCPQTIGFGAPQCARGR
jgi:hypothetical protein